MLLKFLVVKKCLKPEGRCRCMKWENIRSLLRLAVVNNRLTEKQAQYLEEKYCRENKHSN